MFCLLLEGVDGVQELDLLLWARVQHVTNLTIIVVIIIIIIITANDSLSA